MLGLRYVGRVDGILSFVATVRGRRFWCPDSAAVTVFGTCVVYRTEQDLADASIRRHEVQHILQAREMGRLRFWRVYRYHQRILGYNENPLEIDARRVAVETRQTQLDYLRQRGLLRDFS